MSFEKCYCGHCGQHIEYPSEGRGLLVPCPSCKGLVALEPPVSGVFKEPSKEPAPQVVSSNRVQTENDCVQEVVERPTSPGIVSAIKAFLTPPLKLSPQVYLPEVETPLLDSPPPMGGAMTVAARKLYQQLTQLTPVTAQKRTRLGDSPLHRAAKNGIVQAIPRQFLTVESFMERNASGDTPLHIAARLGFLHQVPSVFLKPEALTVWDASGNTVLHIAAQGPQFCRIPRAALIPELLSIPARNGTTNSVLHLLAGANRLYVVPEGRITHEMWDLRNREGLTPRDMLKRAHALRDQRNQNESWRCGPATEKQRNKLRYFGCTWDDGITKGQASEALDDCAKAYPDVEENYYNRPATEEQLVRLRSCLRREGETPEDYAAPGKALTYGEAKSLIYDYEMEERFKEEEEEFEKLESEYIIDVGMWSELYPGLTWKRIQTAAKALDESRPGWREQENHIDIMISAVAELYPSLRDRWTKKGVL